MTKYFHQDPTQKSSQKSPSFVMNLHIIVRIDLDGATADTMASVVASAAAVGDGGSGPIMILIPSGGRGGSGTGRGNSGGGTVRD